jgi:hypothetical protein
LEDRRGTAEKSWRRSPVLAEELGLRYELGAAHLEMGRRLAIRDHLQCAERIFVETGAELDLASARDLLGATISTDAQLV